MSSDVDDIAELLQKAAHDVAHQRKMGWVKGVGFLLAAFGGAGWTAHAYLGQLATKDDITSLERQYSAVREADRSREEAQDRRLAELEPKCAESVQCCIRQGDRLDRMTTPRAFSR